MNNFNFEKHPNELFDQWYLASQGKTESRGLYKKLKVKAQYGLKSVFTQIVPSLERMNYNAMVLATADKNAKPTSRVVLLKKHSDQGYIFYTNYNSQKSKDLMENPVASLNFFWAYSTRQVRIAGQIEKISHQESSQYWDSRPRGSQEGALASNQVIRFQIFLNWMKIYLR